MRKESNTETNEYFLRSLKCGVLYCLRTDRLMHWSSRAQTEATNIDRSFALPFLR